MGRPSNPSSTGRGRSTRRKCAKWIGDHIRQVGRSESQSGRSRGAPRKLPTCLGNRPTGGPDRRCATQRLKPAWAMTWASSACWKSRATILHPPENNLPRELASWGALEAAGKIIHPEDADMLRSQRRELQICLAGPAGDRRYRIRPEAARRDRARIAGIRGRALARRGQLGAAAATAQKLVALNFKVGDNLYWASGIYALASAARPAARGRRRVPDNNLATATPCKP